MSSLSIHVVAFLIDYEVAAHMHKVSNLQALGNAGVLRTMSGWTFDENARNQTLPDEYGDISNLQIGKYHAMFAGSCSSYSSGMSDFPIDQIFEREPIAYILPSIPLVDPCFAAYESPDALKDEFQTRLGWVRLPSNFDWWAHIVVIKGEVIF